MATAHVNGADLYYEERGTGTPVLLIHGTGCNLHSWGQAPDAVAAEHRVIAYDRRGYARSSRPAAKDYGEHARDAVALLRQLDAAPAILVGWSSGGTIALGMAIGRRHDVLGLVLVEPPLFGQLRPTRSLLRVYPRLQALRLLGRHRQAAEGFLRFASASTEGGNSFDRLPRDLREEMLADAVTTTSEFIPSRRPPTGEHLRRRDIASLSCPVEVLIGECSNPWIVGAARRLGGLLPAAHFEHVPGATHSLPLERPEAIRHAVARVAGGSSAPDTAHVAAEPIVAAGDQRN